jgi:hypothetical protein
MIAFSMSTRNSVRHMLSLHSSISMENKCTALGTCEHIDPFSRADDHFCASGTVISPPQRQTQSIVRHCNSSSPLRPPKAAKDKLVVSHMARPCAQNAVRTARAGSACTHFSRLLYFLAPPCVTVRQQRACAPRHCVSCARCAQIRKFPSTLFLRWPHLGGAIPKVSRQQTFRASQCTRPPADRARLRTPSHRYVMVLRTSCTGVWRADRRLLSVRVLIRSHMVLRFPRVPDRSTRSVPESFSTRPRLQGHRTAIYTSPRCE